MTHVRCLPEGHDIARFLGRGLRCRGIGVLQHDVRSLFNQNLRGIRFFCGVKPGVGPDDFELHIRVYLARMNKGRVDPADHFRNREGPDVAHDIRLGHFPSDMALNGATFVKTRRIRRNVIGTFVAGGVFKLHVREFASDVDRWVHIPEGRGKDQVRTVQRHLCHDAFAVRALRDVLDKDRFDFVAKGFFDGKAALVVLVRPAAVPDGTHVDKANFGFFMTVSIGAGCQPECDSRTGQKCCKFHF